ncbi:hypothetical protein BOTBODRAFT_34821 [Botryobasidium botryosum FD-172 SS1]|uniref:Zn(2)-C6 fungal-type domain-containing protein n=1 Tax=Botryobasidium botryosum (strain FD-172 SS1) TaxID=930990 RepID=A0A067M8T3_BOTB1|nr:hypothetical protein BOTBODRAFT_34821 [Botryobasidium botryosum FD-172 SS1]
MSSRGPDAAMVMVLVRGSACDVCRKRKRRCDAKKPACTSCIKAKSPAQCKYAGLGTRKKSAGLLRNLEESVDELESRISFLAAESRESNSEAQTIICPASARPACIPPRVAPRIVHRSAVSSPMSDPYQDSWVHQQDIPSQIQEPLIQAFLKFRWHFGIQWNIPRFLASLKLPTTHPDAPHPAFLNAVLLHGAFFCSTSLKRYEHVFYRRMSRELALSLEKGDRLFDFIRASILAGCYLYGTSRLSEAYTRVSSTMNFAVACGFHEISSPSLDTRFYMIPPCVDAIELGDRISTFWILFKSDRAGSLLLGHPCTLADDEITTILPYPSSTYATGDYLYQPMETIASMYDPYATMASASVSHYEALRAKSTALLHRACVLAARAKGATVVGNTLRQEISRATMASIKFADSLPAFYAQDPEFEDSTTARSTLAPVYIATYATVIQILDILPDENPSYRPRQAQAARSAMSIVKELQDAPFGYIPLLLGWALTPVHAFMVRKEMRYKKSGDKKNATAVQDEIKVLISTMLRVRELFPKPGVIQIDVLEKNASALRLIELA